MVRLFSERYGYVKPSDALIIESMPLEVVNAICNCYDEYVIPVNYEIEKAIWTEFLNERLDEFRNEPVFKYTIEDGQNWLTKTNFVRNLTIICPFPTYRDMEKTETIT